MMRMKPLRLVAGDKGEDGGISGWLGKEYKGPEADGG